MSKTFKLIISIAIPLLVGATAGLFTASNVQGWYANVNKPSFNPPNWIFSPVWTLLYILMGIAMFLVWRSGADKSIKRTALILYAIQLTFNFFQSFIFFELQQPGWAFAEILVLWLMILVTMIWFKKISTTAAWLLAPYFGWVSFASVLNYYIWQLN